MPALEDPRLFLTVLTIVPQLLLFGTDTLGGVSGQDSIIRSSIAALDLSAGLIFLNGSYQFIFEPGDDSYFHIPRWRMLHSRLPSSSNNMKITTRTRWLPIFAHSQRSARIVSENIDQIFVMNSNQFIVPYMQYHKIPPFPLEIQLSRETVHRAAALSIARYFILLATSTVILVIRGILFWNFAPTFALRVIVLLSEIGRWIIVIAQTASVLTYSCQYKAVGTWFSPVDVMPTGSFWDPPTQHAFRALIWENMHYMWHAKIVFWMVEQTLVAVTGRPCFSKFTSPVQTEYEAENGATDLDLLVYDDDVSPVVDRFPKYTIRFRNTPRMVVACLQSFLFATLGQKMLIGVPVLVLGFFGVVAPVVFAYFDSPDPKAKYFWAVEQIVVSLIKYYDWEDWGINTTFGRADALALDDESDGMTRVSDDRSVRVIGGSSMIVPESGQTSAPSVHIEEADIAETEIELHDMKTSELKAILVWAESSQTPE